MNAFLRQVRSGALLRDKTRRALFFTAASIPGSFAMAAWKGALFLVAPSLFLLATVLFNLGVIAAKTLLVRTHITAGRRRALAEGPVGNVREQHRRAYRATGILVTVLSLLYTLSFIPLFFASAEKITYDRPVAVIIAAITFAELGLAIHGTVSARRNRDLLSEAVKLTNVAAGLVLLTLTQSALLSLEKDIDPGHANAVSGVVFGTIATGIGVSMLIRSRRDSTTTERLDADTTERPLPC
ncbi:MULTISPECIES: hypothetical protein [unclassified Frondihabitans]|uniref:hypothetical protein n=1 Tax=unclassified Frondihabitans TaxID=2626248 RepID=UPI000F4E4299|nr:MULTISPECIES: hypothetical protein [unclassified Frondihabitans]RPE76211.1 hypothetical protein EDF37_2031 [Frondihabitans sp. PhB153]RPF05513.1 hypothetical protein EDF39_2217 [Frondihabitans sp. PhB161]